MPPPALCHPPPSLSYGCSATPSRVLAVPCAVLEAFRSLELLILIPEEGAAPLERRAVVARVITLDERPVGDIAIFAQFLGVSV